MGSRMALWASLALAGNCQPLPPPSPPPPQGQVSCEDWCKHASRLGCAAAKPTVEGATCSDVCVNVQDSGIVSFDLACRVRALSCEVAERCEIEER